MPDEHYDERGVLVKPHETPAELGGVLSHGASGHDPVDHPAHYTRNGIELTPTIQALGLGWCLGNVLKYLWRCGHKSGADELEDLKKARWYLDQEIALREQS